jgi:NADPH2 dehydrogenase
VHAKGGVIFVQLWALGRANTGTSGIKVVSSGDVSKPSSGAGRPVGPKPVSLSLEDIKRYQGAFADSAKKAMEAGFDGIELHGARKLVIPRVPLIPLPGLT